jgi:hypothetical protein
MIAQLPLRTRDAKAIADLTEQEMSIMGRYSAVCGYEVFVLRRDA